MSPTCSMLQALPLLALAGLAAVSHATAHLIGVNDSQTATALPAVNHDPSAQLIGHTAADNQLINRKMADNQLMNSEVAANQLINGKAAASQLINGKAAATLLISRREAANQLIGDQSATSRLTDLKAEAGYRSVRLSWRLEPTSKKLDQAAVIFRIRYCENQVLLYCL